MLFQIVQFDKNGQRYQSDEPPLDKAYRTKVTHIHSDFHYSCWVLSVLSIDHLMSLVVEHGGLLLTMSSIKDANFALWIVPERYPTRIGEFCRSETGRPARYIGYGKCVFISESSAEFLVSDALPPEGKEAEHSYVNDAGIAPYVDVLKRLMRQLDTKLPVEFPFKLELTKDGRTF